MDDFDKFKERMLGCGEKKFQPYKKALLFVDNSGADIILGMLPLARELLRQGTEVRSCSPDCRQQLHLTVKNKPNSLCSFIF